jgi:hypothetical protein
MSPLGAFSLRLEKNMGQQGDQAFPKKCAKNLAAFPAGRGKKCAVKANGGLTPAREPRYVSSQKEHNENNSLT